MKALVFHGIGFISLDTVKDPIIEEKNDAIIRITTSAICGTDLHFVRGTAGPMQKGTILGHEAVGIVEEIGKGVRNLNRGDRVIVPSTIACGYCRFCAKGFFAQCEVANPNGPEAGTAFFGGPKCSGPFQGCQAEYVRVPFSNHNLVKIDSDVPDEKAILLSDIFPTAYFAVEMADVKPGTSVVVLGCGPVGQFVIASCKLRGVARIFAVDCIESRLRLAREQGAECINFNEEDPFECIKEATKGVMADVVIDAVGVDACCAHHGPAAKKAKQNQAEFQKELKLIVSKKGSKGKNWIPGDAPSQALRDTVDLVSRCGTISLIGVYSDKSMVFPMGKAIAKNLKIVTGYCNHRVYIPYLLQLVQSNVVDPTKILTQKEPITQVVEAYKNFDAREAGWIKVALKS